MKNSISFFLLFYFLLIVDHAFGQTTVRDLIYLKNGSVIKGTIVEDIPNDKIRIMTSNSSTLEFKIEEYPYTQIERVAKEQVHLESTVNNPATYTFKKS